MKKLIALFAMTLATLSAESVKIRLPNEAANLINALMSLDGTERALLDPATGTERVIKQAYDFGKDAVRIRLTIRKNIIILRDALDAYEQTRVGYCREVFGADALSAELFMKQPEELRVLFTKKMAAVLEPTAIDVLLFKEEDVTQFAAAAVPGTVSVALDPLVAKPNKTASVAAK